MQNQDSSREAKRALERVHRESETIGGSSLARAGRRVGDHLSGRDAVGEADGGTDGGTDPIELWGRRIGRALSLIGVVVLAYLVGEQLRFW